jgi:hypothetical protein
MSDTVRLEIRISPKQAKGLSLLAVHMDMSQSDLVRCALQILATKCVPYLRLDDDAGLRLYLQSWLCSMNLDWVAEAYKPTTERLPVQAGQEEERSGS